MTRRSVQIVCVSIGTTVALLSVVFGAPFLFAYFDETFSVSPTAFTLETTIGQEPATEYVTITPNEGGWEDYRAVPYVFLLDVKTYSDEHCLRYDDYWYCLEYDYEAWAQDGLLCNFLTFGESDDGNNSLHISNDTEDIVPVSLSVPCHTGICGTYDDQHNLAFPEELLDVPLTCDVTVEHTPQVSLAPINAYAQSVEQGTLHIIGTVRSVSVVNTEPLTLPAEVGYDGVRGVRSSGPSPDKGVANSDTFTFKVIYTNSQNNEPESLTVDIGGVSTFSMSVDVDAEARLHDGDMTNGEQYTVATTLPKLEAQYWFTATVDGTSFSLGENNAHETLMLTSGYSSVAFLPGLQASRLFEQGEDDWFENQLWEPNRDADAQALIMENDGTSVHKDIYTKVGPSGVVDEALGFTSNIYKSFLDSLEDWKTEDHVIRDYAVLPYDWRFAFDTILGGGKVDGEKLYFDERYTTDTPHIYAELERLVDGSDTGRVSVIAHSMGGLIIKKMLADLEDNPDHQYRHLLGKIDTVILVASPQLGTPKAVASLLHGVGQDYFPVATTETLRRVASDMPSVYTLLPSSRYFDMVHDVGEDGSTLNYTKLVTGRGKDVTTYDAMRDFMAVNLGEAGDDLTIPMTPRDDYADDAKVLHERIDDWTPPDVNGDGKRDFTVVQIAGWGIQETIKGIEYVEAKRNVACVDGLTGPCTETYLDPRPIWTSDGDGTVVLPSAVAMGEEHDESRGVETWYVDLFNYNKGFTKNRDHASIFEVDPLLDFLRDNIQKKVQNREYMYSNKNNLTTPDTYLRLSMHSPVAMSLQNSEGFVGINDESHLEESIRNAYYLEFGEGKYIGAPLQGEPYTITLQGTGEGTFTCVLTEEREGKIVTTKTFTNVPVTISTQGTLTLSSLDEVTKLDMDTDGDGITDTTVYPEKEDITFKDLHQALQQLNTKAKKQLLKTAHLAERFSKRGNVKVANLMLIVLEKEIIFLSSKKQPQKMRIDKGDAERIVEIIRELKGTFNR